MNGDYYVIVDLVGVKAHLYSNGIWVQVSEKLFYMKDAPSQELYLKPCNGNKLVQNSIVALIPQFDTWFGKTNSLYAHRTT